MPVSRDLELRCLDVELESLSAAWLRRRCEYGVTRNLGFYVTSASGHVDGVKLSGRSGCSVGLQAPFRVTVVILATRSGRRKPPGQLLVQLSSIT